MSTPTQGYEVAERQEGRGQGQAHYAEQRDKADGHRCASDERPPDGLAC